MNIEGGEYDLLPHLIETHAISIVQAIEVQFHMVDKASVEARDRIRTALAATHAEAWCYPFVWEAWTRLPTTSQAQGSL